MPDRLEPCRESPPDRVALVTGAGSPTGIGFATAAALGREGAAVAICSTTERIHARAGALQAIGYDAAGFEADLTDRRQVRGLADEVLDRFGRIDILVNNAGMVTVDDPADEEAAPSWRSRTKGGTSISLATWAPPTT